MPKFKLKAKVEKLDDVAELYRPAYIEREGAFYLDPEKLEAVEFDDKAELAGALDNERKETKAARERLEALKDIDPEEFRRLKTESEQREQDNKKKSNDWEGWKKTFEDGKKAEIDKLQGEIDKREARIRKFTLEDKIKAAFLDAGGRKKLLDDVVLITGRRFRLDDKENIEVLDDTGNPMDVKVDSFFKDKFSTERPEYYEPTGAGGSGASGNNNGSRGGARVISSTDQNALNQNIADIAAGKVVVAP
jgi:hypothetical protein